jgi:hypothetical protein
VIPSRPLRFLLVLLALAAFPLGAARADDGDDAPQTDKGEPEVFVHVPADEMDLLLEADRRGVMIKWSELETVLAAARARAAERAAEPPEDGAVTRVEGTIDCRDGEGALLDLVYRVDVLAQGPSTVPFQPRNLALEGVEVEGGGRYEELDGAGRLRFDGPGARTVHVRARAGAVARGEARTLDLGLAASATSDLTLRLPAGVKAQVKGGGATRAVETPADATEDVLVSTAAGGDLLVAWSPAARGREGPPVLDVETRTLHAVEDGLVRSRVLVHVDVLKTATDRIALDLPEAMALRAVQGKGVTGSTRSDDRKRLVVHLETPVRGAVDLALDGEVPVRPEAGVVLPRVRVTDAARERAQVAVRFGRDVVAREVTVTGGRRLASLVEKSGDTILRYALERPDGSLQVDLSPGAVELEAASTYYLNLGEPGKTLIAAITYHVRQGTAYRLAPRFPAGYLLRTLTVAGSSDGFRRDVRADGTVEIRLDRGLPAGTDVPVLATLEASGADWVPETGSVSVPFPLPSAGAAREEGYVGVGADASFRVLDTAVKDLRPVGAADLTARGISPAGLVYGYRLDGPSPSVTLDVERREPRLEADVVTSAKPAPRQLDVAAIVIHRIERAGVRRLYVDVPTWARDTVRIEAPDVRSTTRLEGDGAPADVPAGYDRWEVALAERVLGRHLLSVTWHEAEEGDDWSVPADRPLSVRVPLERVERSVVIERAEGLEVQATGTAPRMDLAELPAGAGVSPLAVLDVFRLTGAERGPGISVRKHEGADVLEAIAPLVRLRTMASAEGILRTRADVVLVNTGLQFLTVVLPPHSDLVGAVVDAQPVKPLVDEAGRLRIPVPPARARGARTIASLTYETRLGERVSGRVRLEEPTFPGLEVLRTRHEVAFDPAVEIEDVGGDFGERGGVAPTVRRPWLLGLFAGGAAKEVAATARPAGKPAGALREKRKDMEPAPEDKVETDNDLPYEESLGAAGLTDAPFAGAP